jgi:hypothetical protein
LLIEGSPSYLVGLNKPNHQYLLQHRLLWPFHPTCHSMPLYPDSKRPNWVGSHLHMKRMRRRSSWRLQTSPLFLMTYHQLNNQKRPQHRLLRPFRPSCHIIRLYQTATDPNGLGAVVGDKRMPAKKGFDIINKVEKIFKKKKGDNKIIKSNCSDRSTVLTFINVLKSCSKIKR